MFAVAYFQDWTVVLAFFVTLITLGVLLRKHICKPIGAAIQRQLVEVIEHTIEPRLQYVVDELTYNGGNSLKDNVRHLRSEVAELRGEVKVLQDRS